jgi:hypothetical protein
MSRKPCIPPLNSVYRKGWYTEKTLENFKNLFEGKLDEENLPVNNSLIYLARSWIEIFAP